MKRFKNGRSGAPVLNRITTAGKVTPEVAEHAGKKAGKHRVFVLSRLSFEEIEPYPRVDDITPPSDARVYEQNAAGENARLVREYHGVQAELTEQNAADEHFVDSVDRTRLKEDTRRITRRWYRTLAALIFIGEWIIASIVFNILGTPAWESAVAGFVLASLVSASSHFLGAELKADDRNPVVLAISALGATLAIVAIAALRAVWLDATGVVEAMGLSMSATAITVLFSLIQASAVSVATLCSYAHARKDPHAEAAFIALAQAEDRLVRNRDRLGSLRAEYRAKCSEVNHIYRGLCAAWAKGNEHARRRGGYLDKPVWIEHVADIPVPHELSETPTGAMPEQPPPIGDPVALPEADPPSTRPIRTFRARRTRTAAGI